MNSNFVGFAVFILFGIELLILELLFSIEVVEKLNYLVLAKLSKIWPLIVSASITFKIFMV
ncbi:MAG: hypothetical protein ACTSQJ_10615 [Promethearchaeota archaeon]